MYTTVSHLPPLGDIYLGASIPTTTHVYQLCFVCSLYARSSQKPATRHAAVSTQPTTSTAVTSALDSRRKSVSAGVSGGQLLSVHSGSAGQPYSALTNAQQWHC